MDKPRSNDIACFPEHFDGMEQFISEQAAGIKRTGTCLALAAVGAGGLLAFWLKQAI